MTLNNFCPYNLTIVVLPRKKGEKATIFTIPQTDYFLFYYEDAALEFAAAFLSFTYKVQEVYSNIKLRPCATDKMQVIDQTPFYEKSKIIKNGKERVYYSFVTLAGHKPIFPHLSDKYEFKHKVISAKLYDKVLMKMAKYSKPQKKQAKNNEPPELTE